MGIQLPFNADNTLSSAQNIINLKTVNETLQPESPFLEQQHVRVSQNTLKAQTISHEN